MADKSSEDVLEFTWNSLNAMLDRDTVIHLTRLALREISFKLGRRILVAVDLKKMSSDAHRGIDDGMNLRLGHLVFGTASKLLLRNTGTCTVL